MLKNIFHFIGGIFLSIFPPCFAFLLAGIIPTQGNNASFLFYAFLFLFYLPVIFIWQKSKVAALGVIIPSVLVAVFLFFLSYKMDYESETGNVKDYPSLVRLTSTPAGAKFMNVATNKELVLHEPLRGLYDKEVSKIIATHPSFPNVELSAEIKSDSVEFHFDFNKKTTENHPVPFLLRVIK